jgi:uncharacterized protein
MISQMSAKPKPYMNPYLAGLLLGLVLLGTIYITGRGLGASGGIRAIVLTGVKTISPEHWAIKPYYQEQDAAVSGASPLRTWLFFEIIGVVIGALISGIIANRMSLKLEKGPKITNKSRLIFAAFGGALFGFGSQLGRGCTSGSALSGMAVLSFGGILTMMAIFGGAYALAYFFRKLWLA